MPNWERYSLTDNPFLVGTHIDPNNDDDRLNGKVFCDVGLEDRETKLLKFLNRGKYICYVRSDLAPRGTGKSAFMAGVFWKLMEDKKLEAQYLPVWVTVADFRSITHLMGRVFDTLISSGITQRMVDKMGGTSIKDLTEMVTPKIPRPSPTVLLALSKIFSVSQSEMAWKYVNIRRSVQIVSAMELFKYLMVMYSKVEPKRRLAIFIDQFEEYVEYQRGSYQIERLANDIKDIIRMATETQDITFILTIHPTSQSYLMEAGKDILSSYGDIMDSSVTVPKFGVPELIAIAEAYIAHYRVQKPPSDLTRTHPFTQNAMDTVAAKSGGNVRNFLGALHEILLEADEQQLEEIDVDDFSRFESVSLIQGSTG